MLGLKRTNADGLFNSKEFAPVLGKDPAKWKDGDMIFFNRKDGKVTHVGLWDQANQGIISASSSRGKVVRDVVGSPAFKGLMRGFVGARRARLTVRDLTGG